MAISWGTTSGQHQVGIDLSKSPSSPSASTTSMTVTVKFYVRTSLNPIRDNQTLTIRGPGFSDTGVSFGMTRGGNAAVLVATRKYTKKLSYSSSSNATFSASLSGAFNGARPSKSRSTTIPKRPVGKPTAPRNLEQGSITSSSATVKWDGPSDWKGHKTTDFEVDWTPGGSDKVYNKWSRTISGLPHASTIGWRVRAFNSAGNGPWNPSSGYRTFKTKATNPDKPSIDTIAATSSSTVKVAWGPVDPNGASISGYRVRYSKSSSMTSSVYRTTSSRSITLTGLTRYTSYYVQVQAKNSVGYSSWSSTRSVKTQRAAPSKPGKPTVGEATATELPVSWTAPSDNGGASIDRYQVAYDLEDSFTSASVLSTTSRSVTITDLLPDTSYYVRVRAHTTAGYGSWSTVAQLATVTGTPTMPQGLILDNASATSGDISWFAPDDDSGSEVTEYLVQWSADGFVTVLGSQTTVEEMFTLGDLYRFTEYQVLVAAVNVNGVGDSAALTFTTTQDVPAAPGPPTFSRVTANQMTVHAAAPTDDGASPITEYAVEFSPQADFADPEAIFLVTSGDPQITEFTRYALEPETVYWVRTAAVNEIGTGYWSVPVSQQTLDGYLARLRIDAGLPPASAPAATASLYTDVRNPVQVNEVYSVADGKLTVPDPLHGAPRPVLTIPDGGIWHSWTGEEHNSASVRLEVRGDD